MVWKEEVLARARQLRRRLEGRWLLLGTLVPVAAGCMDQAVTGSDTTPLRAAVTGNAEAALKSDQFDLGAPRPTGQPQITEAQARALAQAYPMQFGRMFRESLEAAHGGPIDMRQLRVCGPAYHAQSSLQPLPVSAPGPYRKALGPWWLIALCGANGDVQVSLAVSAYATDLRLVGDQMAFPAYAGNEFRAVGVPRTWEGALPLSPEGAALYASQRLGGRRITEVPELVAPDLRHAYPQAAYWRLKLEPATGKASQQALLRTSDDEVFVGVAGGLTGDPATDGKVGVQVRSDSPLALRAFAVPQTGDPILEEVQRRPDLPAALRSLTPNPEKTQ